MFKVGDEVIVVNINSKDKADSIGGIYTIQEKKDGKYRLWNYWFNTTDVPLFSEDEIRMVTSEDKVSELEKDVRKLRHELYSMENRIEMNYKKKNEDSYWDIDLKNTMGVLLIATIIVVIIITIFALLLK